MMQLTALVLVLATSLAGAQGTTPALPDDARLHPVKEKLDALVSRTAAAGLPAELVVSKVREGLAKGVPASRIEQAAGRLVESLQTAHRFVVDRRPGSPPPVALVRALAEARTAGVDLATADGLVRNQRPAAEVARAVEVLTDLSVRGYPTARAAVIVREVLAREPGAVGRVPAVLETLRQEQALTHVESVDALTRGMSGAKSLQAAYARTVDDERRRGAGRERPQAKGDRQPGGTGFVPPGLNKAPAVPPRMVPPGSKPRR